MSAPRIVLVTGANKNIGYEIVKSLLTSPKPYHVFLGSRSVENGERAVATLRKECAASPNTVENLQIDVTDDASIEAAFEKVKGAKGVLDVLINNAGKPLHRCVCCSPPPCFASPHLLYHFCSPASKS